MKTRTLLLLAVTFIALAMPLRTLGATLLWTNELPVNATVTDLLPDGQGGVVVCYAVAPTAYVIYLDKTGLQRWLISFDGASEADPFASADGVDYSFGPDVPTANKDAKGFFLIRRVIATNARSIQRYSYK
ncbi:MAG: hypothetical protein NTV22_15815 [bacterium]|nr:hypothetical protein [bacterium]